MKSHGRIFLTGLAVTAPAAITIYLLYATVMWIGGSVRQVFPWLPEILGFLAALVAGAGVTYAVGLLMRVWLFARLLRWGEKGIDRIPLVKTLYGALRDLLKFFGGDEKRPKGQAVRLDLGPAGHMLGVTTGLSKEGDRVGVYLPMSYQIGGFLVYVARERLTPAGMEVEAALKLILTGGMAVRGPETAEAPPAR